MAERTFMMWGGKKVTRLQDMRERYEPFQDVPFGNEGDVEMMHYDEPDMDIT